MVVTVKGTVMEVVYKDGKYTLSLFQAGERDLVRVRTGKNGYKEGDVVELKGRLIAWPERRGVGMMVMADE